ncbi:NAD(P)/FAD-dependent oxidoreductase [Chondromyces crocatus]|uniref:Electron-transferring-flavoprotein dehydrogenase n=1 Tax=Chondromyces crocatus TaxID=52 RepID=A0A0K1EC06_CHOCO|nr:NAD(P)/FAD-dependent oxidoreductase [Chondromyces crocatus]AKT38389.1 electron-transferring-flavoprotein dehydrogenase [Chondromyces crocatus]
MRAYDVVIIGSGIAGGFLARHLRRTLPDLSVLVLEAAETIEDYKVGESTVEVAASYMIRRLDLGTYLYQHQLPKNGLRFFFDSPGKDLPLQRMSEIGSDHLPYHPSFQLERAKLERDLVTMNRADGADVQLGAKVVDLRIDGAGSHTVTYEQAGARHEITCRWLCDASGRRHVLLRKLGKKVHKETRLNTAAAWARYRGVAGLDAVRDDAWRNRVRYTARHLSTNHLMYDGYWIWFIPLAGDLMSVGVVYDKDRLAALGTPAPRNRADFERFLDGHRAVRDLLSQPARADMEDFQAYAHLPYHADLYFSTDRIAVTGEAGAFTDPFYSPGSDFIATANEFIVSMISSEIAGERSAFEEKVAAYDAYYRFKYESTLLLYARMYPIFGSFELYRLKYLLDFNNYYNLVLWPFVAGRVTDVAWLREELRLTDYVLRALSTMGDHFSTLAADLHRRGEYFACNEGQWANGLNGVSQLQRRITPNFDGTFRRDQIDRAYGSVSAALLERQIGATGLSNRAPLVSELSLREILRIKEFSPEAVANLSRRIGDKLTQKLRQDLPTAGITGVHLDLASPSPIIQGPAEDSDEHARAHARAQALWDTPADSLAHVVL